MSTTPASQQLRSRADSLRKLSAKISKSPALTVCSGAGPDTWVGPTPDRCYEALKTIKDQLKKQQSTLIDSAALLEKQAERIENQITIPIHGPM
jgi:FtsZ-interacting cell division protein YlmF